MSVKIRSLISRVSPKRIIANVDKSLSRKRDALSWTKDLRSYVKKTNIALERNPNYNTYDYFFNSSGKKRDYNDLKKQVRFSNNIFKNLRYFYETYKMNLEALSSLY